MTWQSSDVDRADCSNGAARSKLAVLIGDADSGWFSSAESLCFDPRDARGKARFAAEPQHAVESHQEAGVDAADSRDIEYAGQYRPENPANNARRRASSDPS